MRRLLLMLLAVYKRWVSPQLPMACRFTPTCSDYAAEAVTRHGALGGTLLALWRLLRCNPLGGRGLDPVPEHFCRCRPAGGGQWPNGGYGPTDGPPDVGAPGNSLATGTGQETALRPRARGGPQALEPRRAYWQRPDALGEDRESKLAATAAQIGILP